MFGLRFFWTFSMALCLCVAHWEQAYAADAVAVSPGLVVAAQVKSVKMQKEPGESKVSKVQADTKAGKQTQTAKTRAETRNGKSASAKAAISPQKAKNTVKPATASPKNKPPTVPSAQRRKRAPLLPPSTELPQSGIASWVGRYFEGRPVAKLGERHVMESFTAAHRAIAFNTILKVTDLNSGRTVLVRVNDRGPYIRGRVIDLAKSAAEYLGFADKGITTVRLEFAGNAKDPAQRYYIRMRPAKGPGKADPVRGFGPFDKFDEAAALFMNLYKSYPDAELLAVRETS